MEITTNHNFYYGVFFISLTQEKNPINIFLLNLSKSVTSQETKPINTRIVESGIILIKTNYTNVISTTTYEMNSQKLLLWSVKVGTHNGTSTCNKLQGQVPSCGLAIFASKSSRWDQLWSLWLVPWIQISLNFLGQVPATCSSEHFAWSVCGTSPCDQSLHVNSSADLLVAGTSPLACTNLKSIYLLMYHQI